jgi:hypothetical protein
LNPKLEEQRRPVLGLEILRVAERRANGSPEWNGSIYDPGSGRTYRCTITTDGADRLRLRGYVGVSWLGRTTTWLRVGREEQMCRDAALHETSASAGGRS